MKKIISFLLILICLLVFNSTIYAAVFQTNATGNWNDVAPTTWTLVSGADVDGIPDADDDVTVLNTHTITVNISGAICNNLTINDGGTITISTAGGGKDLTVNTTLQINGTLTIGNAANRFLDAKNDVIIGNTGTLNNQRKFIMYAAKNFQIIGSGTYIHNPNTSSDDTMFSLATENFSATSNVTISTWTGTTTALTANMTGNYGNLTLNYTGGNWEQDGNLGIVNTIQGDLTIGAGCVITLDNTKTIDITVTIGGNLTIDATGELWVKYGQTGNVIMNVGGLTTFSGANFYLDYSDNGNVTFTTAGYRQTSGTFAAIYAITSGEGQGDFTFNNTGAFEMSGGYFYGIKQASATNHGNITINTNSVSFTGGELDFYRALATDGKTLSFNCTNNFSLNFSAATDVFTLTGTLSASHNPVIDFNVGGDFISAGNSAGAYFATTYGSGTENITITGNMTLGGGDINFNGDETNNGNGHDVILDIGTVGTPKDLTVSAGKLRMSTYTGAATVTVTGNMTVSGTGEASIKVGSGSGTLNVNGDLTQSGGTFYFHKSTTATAEVTAATVDGDFSHTAGTLTFDGSGTSTATHTLTANGNWSNSVSSWTLGKSEVIFNSSSAQTIAGTQSTTFYNLTINNSSAITDGVSINTATNVATALTLTRGIVNTTPFAGASTLTLKNAATTSTGVGDPNPSYINGQLINTIATSVLTIVNFPIGKVVSGVSNWRPVELTAKHTDATSVTYTGELLQSSASDLGYTNAAGTDKVSSIRYWDIARSAVANLTNATIKIYYKSDNGANDGVTDYLDLTIVKTTNSGSPWIDIGGTATADGTGSIGFSNTFTSFSKFTLANKTGGTNSLPVELISFDAVLIDNIVELNWTTASETNNDYFTIERSDGTIDNWNEITTVKGAGNSSSIINYEFTDNLKQQTTNKGGGLSPLSNWRGAGGEVNLKPQTSNLYYRLKQSDFDGKFNYSPIVSVNISTKAQIKIFPNPLHNKTAILDLKGLNENEKITVVIHDVTGRKLFSEIFVMVHITDVIVLDCFKKLPEGSYYIIVSTQNEIYTQKIIVQ